MAKGAYVGVDGVAHKVKKIYTGVDNVAKQVKKGYVGVGGVARPFFGAEAGVEYYGVITPLSVARYQLAATTVWNYALFGGGYGNYLYKDTVDAYNGALTRSTPTALSVARYQLAATTVGNYALFGGGYGSNPSFKDTIDAYNGTLTRSTPTVLSAVRFRLAATTVGNYALFGCGGGSNSEYKDAVDAYDTNLTRSTPTALSVARSSLSATTVGNYALFGGGGGSSPSGIETVDAYVDNEGAEIRGYLAILDGEANYNLTDLIDGTIFNIAQHFEDYLTLKRGHAYRFSRADSEVALEKSIRNIDVNISSESGVTDYEYKGAIGYDNNTIYIAPNISVPTDAGDPDDPLILVIAVYFA